MWMCLRAQSWQVAESGSPLSSLTQETVAVLIPRSHCLPTHRGEPWVSGQSGRSQRWCCRVLATSGVTAPAQRFPRCLEVCADGEFMWKSSRASPCRGSEALMAKRLAYLTGQPAHPRLRDPRRRAVGAGQQLRSCQPQNKPFSSWEQRREVSLPGPVPSHTSSSWGSEDGPLSASVVSPTPR